MQKLFLSFSWVLANLSLDRLAGSDRFMPQRWLDHGLFFLDRPRAYVMDPSIEGVDKDERRGKGHGFEAHAKLLAALKQAEAEGRVAWDWRKSKGSERYQTLNELLVRNGFSALPMFELYEHEAVERAIKAAGMELEVEG